MYVYIVSLIVHKVFFKKIIIAVLEIDPLCCLILPKITKSLIDKYFDEIMLFLQLKVDSFIMEGDMNVISHDGDLINGGILNMSQEMGSLGV